VRTLGSVDSVSALMRTSWAWPVCESLHFIGLALLVGTIGIFDLRLLGVAKRVPIAALHRLVPWGVGGYILNLTTGLMFLLTEPDQYILNTSFHLKMLFMALAGCNVAFFYLRVFREVKSVGAGGDVPRVAKFIGAASLLLWIGVMTCGRLLTFYRPYLCDPDPGFLLNCFPVG
jgi:hypothetical protein